MRDRVLVAAVVAAADAAVNAVSAYVETVGVTFDAVHVHGPETIAQEAAAAGVSRLVLVSGIGADPKSDLPYIRARARRASGRTGLAGRDHRPPRRHIRSG